MILLQLMELVASEPEKGPQLMAVARSESIEMLRALIALERVEPYLSVINDQAVTKTFRLYGPLEMYGLPTNEAQMFLEVGTKEERLQNLIAEVTERVNAEWAAIEANTVSCNDGFELAALAKATPRIMKEEKCPITQS